MADPLAAALTSEIELDPAERVRQLLAEWNAHELAPSEGSSSDLFHTWEELDARMTPEEREAEDRLWDSVLNGLDETPRRLGMRPLHPHPAGERPE